MHLLFVSDNFPPEVNAPASRTFEHCREWVKAGHEVTVITCVPNFPRGRVYEGHRNRLYQTEVMDGIRVIRVWSYITANDGFIKRILDYVSFMVSAVVAAPTVKRPDLVIGTSPQFFSACAAFLIGRMKRKPFVFELRDIWPESIKAVGAMPDSLVIRTLERVELFLYQKANLIVSVTHSFKRILAERGVDSRKIVVVTNGVDGSRFKAATKDPELVKRYNLDGKFIVGYVGTHGMAHHLETILDAADRVRKRARGEVVFLLLGDGARKDALKEIAESMNLDNVIFIDSVAKEAVVRYWSLLDLSVIHLKKTDLFQNVIPSKLFECMAMGIPVLHGVAGESAAIVEKEQVGIFFEPENAEGLCEGLLRMKNDPGLHAALRMNCLASAGRYDRSALAKRMLERLSVLVHDVRRGSNRPSAICVRPVDGGKPPQGETVFVAE